MDGHCDSEIYRYKSDFWSLDQFSKWNNEVLCDSDDSISGVWPSQKRYHSRYETIDALNEGQRILEAPDETITNAGTELVPFAPPIEEPYVVLGGRTSSVTLGHGSEPSTSSSRFSTPALTDASTIVPVYAASVTEEPAEDSRRWTSPSIHSNGSMRRRNELSLTEPFRSQSVTTTNTIASTKDRYICLHPGCEVTCRNTKELRRHFLKHIDLVFSCPIPGCGGRTFTRKDTLFAHARVVHRKSPLTMFESVDLRSKLHTPAACGVSQNRQLHRLTPEASLAEVQEVKDEPSNLELTCLKNSRNIPSSMQSQLAITDSAPVSSAQDSNANPVDFVGLTEANEQNLLIPAEKVVGYEQSKSISLSLWPPQYLALLELGVIQKIDAVLKSDTFQSETSDDTQVLYSRTDKSLRLTGAPQRVEAAKLIVLEGIESLASDTEARARQEIWSKHVVPDTRLQPRKPTTTTTNTVMQNEAKSPSTDKIKLQSFVLHGDGDDDLIKAWHDAVLPALDGLLSSTSDPNVVVTLQREGNNEAESQATIRICSSMSMSDVERDRLKVSLISLLPERLRSSCRVEFSRGSIRRSGSVTRAVAHGEYQPPICAPRNRRWFSKPTMGASIGRRGSQDDTATLGGYVLIDGITHILTVHHLFEEERESAYSHGRLRKSQYQITQPSEQDIRDIGAEIVGLRDLIGLCEAEQATLLEWMSQLKELEKLQTTIPGDERLWRFGKVLASSGYRSRVPRKAPDAQSSLGYGSGKSIEMDWAVCSVPEDRVGLNEIESPDPCDQNSAMSASLPTGRTRQDALPQDKQCTKICEPAGRVVVHSLGRTSHYQIGVVSPCGAHVHQKIASGGFRSSVEWIVMRHAHQSLAEWSEGGMGVDGDSGSWIVREDNNDVMGMLWGRIQNEDVADPITLFTPIQDVFDDIIDTIGPKSLCLPQGVQVQPIRPESLSTPQVAESSNKRKISNEMLPPFKRRNADTVAPRHRCGKCLAPPPTPLHNTPPSTPTSASRYCGSPQQMCNCASEISPPDTPASWT